MLSFELRAGRIPAAACVATAVAALVRAISIARGPAEILAASIVGLVPLAARGVTRGGVGWGDVRLALPLALLLGPRPAALGMVLACLLGLCSVGLGSVLDTDATYEAGFAFGPYMVAGAIIALLVEALHA